MKILLVEDDPIIRLLISSQLVTKGNFVITAKNGVNALEVLLDNPNTDIIITDIMMPQMGGVELANQLLNSEFNQIPIMAITGGTYLEENNGNPSPFREVLQKPVYIQDLIDQINHIINLSKN
ncbi:response regulator [Mongoliitalea daihaiensis]|uniref:response regulator n=1 Tax=Mongoliitalea daihaiensis TaxID=2782006 RepID=UPI001F2F2D26|nr:response regulator [Mongoliitalea daihaiensis]UJP65212.1 response regulator [Mongoliitalea daihaiensis]